MANNRNAPKVKEAMELQQEVQQQVQPVDRQELQDFLDERIRHHNVKARVATVLRKQQQEECYVAAYQAVRKAFCGGELEVPL